MNYIILSIILIILAYKLDFSMQGDIWYYFTELYFKYSKNFKKKVDILNKYLQQVGHGQLYIYKDYIVYSRFCNLQKLLLGNEILYKYDPERRPAKARDIQHQHYFVFDCFINLTESLHSNVLNVHELVNYFEQQYKNYNNKTIDYASTLVECEFVCIANNKTGLANSFYYNISTKLKSYNNRDEFIACIVRLLATELFKENGVLNSYSLEEIALANMYYYNIDYSKITEKDIVEAISLTFRNRKIMNNPIKRQFSTKTTKKLTTKKLDKKLSDFGVFDIETFIYEGKHIPYCASYLDNENSFTYYLSNDNSLSIDTRKDMLIEQFFDKVIEVAKGKYVFAHNFSKFDGFYVLPYFMQKTHDGKIDPKNYKVLISTQGENKIYSIDYKIKRKTIKFRDWFLLVNESLKNLALLFKLEDKNFQKTIFPYAFLKETPSNLFYKGDKPSFDYFYSKQEVIINKNITIQVPLIESKFKRNN